MELNHRHTDFQSLYGADIDELKNQIKNIEDNKIVKKSNKALKQLDSLKEKGLITEDDYEIKKKEITDREELL